MRQDLRASNGKLIGWLENGIGGRINGRDAFGRLIGWYDPVRDETRDPTGRLVGHGNLLSKKYSIFQSINAGP